MPKKITYQYSWHYDNNFQVLIDGIDFFSSMLEAIKQSQNTILFESYLFESGEIANKFITELCSANERGVKIYILLDEYGSRGLLTKDKSRLLKQNIQLSLYNPASIFHFAKSLRRDHRKLLIVDNKTAFIGGAGITDNFNQNLKNNYWHDVMLKIQGSITLDFTHSFSQLRKKYNTHSNLDKVIIQNTSIEGKNKSRVLTSSGSEKNEIIKSIINHIRSSKVRVWITSPYFISSWKVRRALRYAAKKGLDVRLIFPGPYSDHRWISYGIQRYYQRLLKANIAIYEYQPRFTHAKVILCDDWYTIGSSNLDRWNQFLNLDVNIEVYDKQSHQQITQLFESDFKDSSLIILNQWSARSLMQKFKEWLSGKVILFLGFISQKFKR